MISDVCESLCGPRTEASRHTQCVLSMFRHCVIRGGRSIVHRLRLDESHCLCVCVAIMRSCWCVIELGHKHDHQSTTIYARLLMNKVTGPCVGVARGLRWVAASAPSGIIEYQANLFRITELVIVRQVRYLSYRTEISTGPFSVTLFDPTRQSSDLTNS